MNEKKQKLLLRKAAYWLRDYASCFARDDAPSVVGFRNKMLKLAQQCRTAGREEQPHDIPEVGK